MRPLFRPSRVLPFVAPFLVQGAGSLLGQEIEPPSAEAIEAARSAPLFASHEPLSLTLEADLNALVGVPHHDAQVHFAGTEVLVAHNPREISRSKGNLGELHRHQLVGLVLGHADGHGQDNGVRKGGPPEKPPGNAVAVFHVVSPGKDHDPFVTTLFAFQILGKALGHGFIPQHLNPVKSFKV